ncbi:MAG: hypothetical protein ACFFFK_04290 [Candidatus Thorarchaeota archaeon]
MGNGKDTLDVKEFLESSDHESVKFFRGDTEVTAVFLNKAVDAFRRMAERSIEVGKPISVRDVMKHLSVTENDVLVFPKMDNSMSRHMNTKFINYRVEEVSGDFHIHCSY